MDYGGYESSSQENACGDVFSLCNQSAECKEIFDYTERKACK